MNTPITFPPPEPTLKLVRPTAEKWAATLAEERRRLHEDHEALREREQNLRDYEARLRSLQAEIDAARPAVAHVPVASIARSTSGNFLRPSSKAPFNEDPALQAAWEKLHRARELLEAEQKNLRDDRIALHELDRTLKDRELSVAAREAKIAEREALIAAATPETSPVEEQSERSAMSKLTRGPFNMARSVFNVGKK